MKPLAQTPALGSLHSVVAHVAETYLRSRGSAWSQAAVGGGAGTQSPGHLDVGWPAETLLVGAADRCVFTDFSRRAQAERLEVLFYESTAMGRWSDGPAGHSLLDLAIRPRLGVHSALDAARARELLRLVQRSCSFGREMGAGFTVDPVVEVWQSREPRNPLALGPASPAGH